MPIRLAARSALKEAFEAKHAGGHHQSHLRRFRELAGRILKGETCDVFAPSSPAVIDEDLMNKKVTGSGRDAATWYVVFSANEMVVITATGNPLRSPDRRPCPARGEIHPDNGREGPRHQPHDRIPQARCRAGRKTAARAADRGAGDRRSGEGHDGARHDQRGEGWGESAAITYYSAAVAARHDIDIVRFPDSVNMSEAIRNAAVVPGTARNVQKAMEFVRFLLSAEAQAILKETGQPPVVPALRKGAVPASLNCLIRFPIRKVGSIGVASPSRENRHVDLDSAIDGLGMNTAHERLDLRHLVLGHVDDHQDLPLLDFIGELFQARIGDRGADHARGPASEHRAEGAGKENRAYLPVGIGLHV